MKIPYDNRLTKQYQAVICLSKDCPWTRECANHTSAGDFRSEGGFSPELYLESGEVHCKTFDNKPLYGMYSVYPEEMNKLSCGSVCWKDLNEIVDNYQI